MYRKLYLAGPMTGYKHFNFPAFDKYAYTFRQMGDTVFSPADHDRELLGKPKDWMPHESDSVGPWKGWAIEGAPTLRKMLGDDLKWIAKNAEGLVMLQGWEKSSGARAEHALAVALGLEIIYVN